ncbi:deoxyribonuclease IV [Lactobacillus selangorensis]|nr:deoxyribonuclease IV [Lactobacillus selangorensis]
MKIGSHVSMKGTKMLLGSAQEAAAENANAFMIYTGAPQNTRRKPTEKFQIEPAHAYMQEHGIDTIVVHAPYIVNLGNTLKPDKFEFGVQFMRDEVARADAIGAQQMAFHPGAHVGAGADAALQQIIKGLNEILTEDQTVHIAIETMAGKGTEVGTSFEQLATIIDGVQDNDKLSVCFDTCHTSDAGYAIKDDFDGVLNEFDHLIGLDRLQLIHLNDSKNPQGSHKDRHENIGFGTIGFDTLNYVAHHPQLETVPKILETPYIDGSKKKRAYSPYKREIAMLETETFDPEMKDEILAENEAS